MRNTVLATWLLALPIYALFPVAPPRLADIFVTDIAAGLAVTVAGYALGRAAIRLRGSGLHAELEPAHVPVPAT
jgi:hypothetical protein